MPFPSPLSLYSILMADQALSSAFGALKSERKPYKLLDTTLQSYTNEKLLDIIYNDGNAKARQSIVPAMARNEFEMSFNRAVERAKKIMDEIALTIIIKSFPETYFHPGIAKALVTNNTLTNSSKVFDRVAETAEIVLKVMDTASGMRHALAMGYMHSVRREFYQKKGDYKAETVEFTLLTFSYFGAKAYKVDHEKWMDKGTKAQDWFFFWKIVGSLMGLPNENLHSTYEQAQTRMQEIHKNCDLNEDGKKLLTAYEHATFDLPMLGEITGENLLETLGEFLSKRMRDYRKNRPK